MAVNTNPPDDNLIMRAIQAQVTREIDAMFEEEKEKLVKRFDELRAEIIAKASIRIGQHMSVTTHERVIRIEIDKEYSD